MDGVSHKLLESATHRTLHAHSFSRSSSHASLVLTDLLSRYLMLLSATCAKYAQHAGRTRMTSQDAIGALNELGVSINELSEYCSLEGKEVSRYAVHSARRAEDLNEFKVQLADGLRHDRDDAIPLQYARFILPSNSEDEDGVDDEEERMETTANNQNLIRNTMNSETSPPQRTTPLFGHDPELPQIPTPPLSLVSIYNSSSPSRKRPRTSTWQSPPHVPDFFPPFPKLDIPSSPGPCSPQPIKIQFEQPLRTEGTKIDKPLLPLSQPLTSSSASDYLVQVPYSQSSLAGVAEWHLPPPLSSQQPVQPRVSILPTPLTEPSLFAAYHHILTHPPIPNSNIPTPSRHKVAMALLSQIQKIPRWELPDTLYSSVAPCAPRISTIGPTYPTAIGDPGFDSKGKVDGKDKDFKLPSTLPRPVSSSERLTPLVSQQSSRLPDLARGVLPPTILARTSRLTHPPPLQRGSKLLLYGSGIPAPWNANILPPADTLPTTPAIPKSRDKDSLNGLLPKGGGEPLIKPVLPDARLYATWDYESKDFRAPLVPAIRNRGRMGSVQGGSGAISLASGPRGKTSKTS